jgi:hypothetical protein
MRGESHVRPFGDRPGAGSSRRAGLPDRDASPSAHIAEHGARREVRTRDVRVEGPREGRVPACVIRSRGGCARLDACADDVPFLGDLRASAVVGRAVVRGETAKRRAGPTEAHVPTTPREGHRVDEGQDAFHRHEREGEGRIAPPVRRLGSSPTPPTLCPQAGESAFSGLASVTLQSPADA